MWYKVEEKIVRNEKPKWKCLVHSANILCLDHFGAEIEQCQKLKEKNPNNKLCMLTLREYQCDYDKIVFCEIHVYYFQQNNDVEPCQAKLNSLVLCVNAQKFGYTVANCGQHWQLEAGKRAIDFFFLCLLN